MSHWTVARLKIRNPDLRLLKQAMAIIAQELGSQVVEDFEVVGWGAKQRCLFAIPMRLPYGNGYGVYIDPQTGEVRIVVDDHGAPLTAQEFADKLAQYYTALALAQVAQQLGFVIQSFEQSSNAVIIDLAR